MNSMYIFHGFHFSNLTHHFETLSKAEENKEMALVSIFNRISQNISAFYLRNLITGIFTAVRLSLCFQARTK